MTSLSKELNNLIERLLGEDAESGVFDILNSPEHWNYDYFLSLLPLLSNNTEQLIVLAPEFVAKGSRQLKEDKPPRHTLIAKNILDAVITLPVQMAQHKNLPVCLMLFNTTKEDSTVLFINAAQKFQTKQGKEMVQEAQVGKIVATYNRVRNPINATNPEPIELSSPACYADQFDQVKPGVIIDHYAYLATLAEIARRRCSISPVDYVV